MVVHKMQKDKRIRLKKNSFYRTLKQPSLPAAFKTLIQLHLIKFPSILLSVLLLELKHSQQVLLLHSNEAQLFCI